MKLQQSCKEHKAENEGLTQRVQLLKHEGRERERIWKSVWAGQHPGVRPPIPDSTLFSAASPTPTPTPASPVAAPVPQYDEPYVDTSCSSTGYPTQYPQHHYLAPSPVHSHSSSAAMAQHTPASPSVHYSPYAQYPLTATTLSASTSSAGHSTTPPLHSPSAYSDHRGLAYGAPQYILDERGNPMAAVDAAGYVIEHSPTSSGPSTPISTSSVPIAPLAPTYQYPSLSTSHEHSESAYTRSAAHSHGIPLTLHGGTADISAMLASSSRPFSYGKSTKSTPLFNAAEVTTSTASSESPLHERSCPSSGGPETTSSRSPPESSSPPPSPGGREPFITDTLSIIKAAAFGTQRRTNRTRSKKSASTAQQVVESLEKRGTLRGLPSRKSKRSTRSQSDEDDDYCA
jgi:hypothetical protein